MDSDPGGCVTGFVLAMVLAVLTVFAFHLTEFQAGVVSFGFTALFLGVYS